MKKLLLLFTLLFLNVSLLSAQGILYGTTSLGGKYNQGVMFSYNIADSAYSVIINFDSLNGSYPAGSFTYNPADGLLYMAVQSGGKNNHGVIFSYNPFSGKDSIRCMIDDAGEGAFAPQYNAMALYKNKFYLSTFGGGTYSSGTLLSFNPATNKDSLLFSFNGNYPDNMGLNVYNNMLYGTTEYGGDSNAGTIYSYDPATGKDSLLVSFRINDGQQPAEGGGLTFNPKNGLFFGMTIEGGASGYGNGNGVIYSFNPNTGKDSLWFIFNGHDGQQPQGGFTVNNNDGLFYANTVVGGAYGTGDGNIISFNPNTGQEKSLFSFNTWANEPIQPNNNLVYDSVNNLYYGSSQSGGDSNYGGIFCFDPVKDTIKTLVSFNGTDGAYAFGSMFFIPQALTGIKQVTEIKSAEIYPNPFSGYTNIKFSEGGIHYIEVYDISGRIINNVQCNGIRYTLVGNGLEHGMYFVKIYDSSHNYIATSKIVVQ